jgi:hypothetical protein
MPDEVDYSVVGEKDYFRAGNAPRQLIIKAQREFETGGAMEWGKAAREQSHGGGGSRRRNKLVFLPVSQKENV